MESKTSLKQISFIKFCTNESPLTEKGKMLLDMQDSVTGGQQRLTVGSPTD